MNSNSTRTLGGGFGGHSLVLRKPRDGGSYKKLPLTELGENLVAGSRLEGAVDFKLRLQCCCSALCSWTLVTAPAVLAARAPVRMQPGCPVSRRLPGSQSMLGQKTRGVCATYEIVPVGDGGLGKNKGIVVFVELCEVRKARRQREKGVMSRRG